MARVFLIDESNTSRDFLRARLEEAGHRVEEFDSTAAAAEAVPSSYPDAIISDLWMPGISGLQFCRLLRTEAETAQIPVFLITASEDRRSRFWAHHAGATSYFHKGDVSRLLEALSLHALSRESAATIPPPASKVGHVAERLSQLLESLLLHSTITGEVRSLAHVAEDPQALFLALTSLASALLPYRWMALRIGEGDCVWTHTHPALQQLASDELCAALRLRPENDRRADLAASLQTVVDERPVSLPNAGADPVLHEVRFGQQVVGMVGFSLTARALGREERRLIALLAEELGGVLRMASLVKEAQRLAATDTLTGLPNRRMLDEAFVRLRAQGGSAALLLLDVDHFKAVNDQLGHEAGDAVLRQTAQVLRTIARASDTVARWGGEEFVVLLANTSDAGARIAAERARRAIAEHVFVVNGQPSVRKTVSIGLAATNQLAQSTLDDLFARADRAMYYAKERGRNRIEIG